MSRRQKSWKEIEQSRNRRLWITGVGLPILGMGLYAYSQIPEVKKAVNDVPYKMKKGWAHLKNRFHKKE